MKRREFLVGTVAAAVTTALPVEQVKPVAQKLTGKGQLFISDGPLPPGHYTGRVIGVDLGTKESLTVSFRVLPDANQKS